MHWFIYIKMFSHDRSDWHWTVACSVFSTEMLGIVERALQSAGQETKSEKMIPMGTKGM